MSEVKGGVNTCVNCGSNDLQICKGGRRVCMNCAELADVLVTSPQVATQQASQDNLPANDRQVGGSHYQRGEGKIQHWDMVAEFGLDYFQGVITKYLFRWRAKGGAEDLEKARHYLDKYIELVKEGKITGG